MTTTSTSSSSGDHGCQLDEPAPLTTSTTGTARTDGVSLTTTSTARPRTVYLLRDPQGVPRYVGTTTRDLSDRLASHIYDARLVRGAHEKGMRAAHEIRALLDAGYTRDDITIELAPVQDEDAAIDHYRALGYDLWNERAGGGGRRTDVDWSRADGLWGTVPDGQIAELVGASASRVCARRLELGIAPYRRGLSDEDVLAIRRERARPGARTYRDIAADYGVTADTISRAARGLSHQHLPTP